MTTYKESFREGATKGKDLRKKDKNITLHKVLHAVVLVLVSVLVIVPMFLFIKLLWLLGYLLHDKLVDAFNRLDDWVLNYKAKHFKEDYLEEYQSSEEEGVYDIT